MYTQDTTRPTSPRVKLEQAIALAKSGHQAEAREILRGVVALQPVNQAAWLWLSAVSPDQTEAEAALVQAKKIDPTHSSLLRAEQWLIHRFSPTPPTKKNRRPNSPPKKTASVPKTSKNPLGIYNSVAIGLVVAVLLVGLLVLVLGLIWEVNAAAQPDDQLPNITPNNSIVNFEQVAGKQIYLPGLDAIWAEQDWPKAIAILEDAYRITSDSQLVKEQLAQAYLQNGITLRKKGFIEEARVNFERALIVDSQQEYAEQVRAEQEHLLVTAYLAGVQHYQAGRWQAAISELETVWQGDNNYINVKDLLYSAHYNLGLARQAAGELAQAKEALEAAVSLRPDLSQPYRLISEIEFAMAAQTPVELSKFNTSVENKAIVVGIAEQRMAVYDGEEQVFDFIVSTGEPGRETAIGEFEIQNKIDMAYASTWNLDMPYWMGIYWAGSLQNGIHSLPVVKHTGYKLWDGYLGQRVSYGCVILSDEDAATLYDWAEVGVKVKIIPSLANWTPDD